MILQTFFFHNMSNDIKKLYIFVGKLFSTHATVCTSLILQASRRAGLSDSLPLKGGGIMQITRPPEAIHAGEMMTTGRRRHRVGQQYEQNTQYTGLCIAVRVVACFTDVYGCYFQCC